MCNIPPPFGILHSSIILMPKGATLADVNRIEVITTIPDARATTLRERLHAQAVWVRDVYTIKKELDSSQVEAIAKMLTSPVTQAADLFAGSRTGMPQVSFDWTIEIGFLPGVTDNIGSTAREGIEDLLAAKFGESEGVYSTRLIIIQGVDGAEVKAAVSEMHNPLIQRATILSNAEWQRGAAATIIVPQVKLRQDVSASIVDLDVSDEELTAIGKIGIANPDGSRRGPMALDLSAMKAVKDHFMELGRKPTDIELESIAQTWSEHCKHTIFADPLDEITDGIYKTYIKAATEKIRADKGDSDICVSVFTDNSGAIKFDDTWLVTHKVETHNTPSTLDPFGGSITGIVGVNRDTIGFGLGAKPVINVYGFCLVDPRDQTRLYRDEEKTSSLLTSERIMNGVVAGVNSGGNQSGIPSPQGFLYFDPLYKGKPLVFAGTVGLIPAKIGERLSHEKQANPGDLIVVIGGRVGLDGIHGATFSSVEMDKDSPATAVQIGDPITQKKLSDAIVKEARDANLYSSITDNGAGGLSCSVAEMAKESGGFEVQLEKVPLKYPNLAPWQIWVSESQERMTLAVPPAKWEAFKALMDKRGVEATVIGTFTNTGRCLVNFSGQTVMDVDIEFLHDGLPKTHRHGDFTPPVTAEPQFAEPSDWNQEITDFIGSLNLASTEFVSKQYDHEVQAGSVLKPLQGRGRINSPVSVTRPVLESAKAVALSQALYPSYSELDPYAMAAAAIDTTVRNLVAAGADLDTIHLLDNFCWCSSNDPMRLGQLKLAAKACYDYAVAYSAPFISGKDSMFNDFKGFDEEGNPVAISVPPTLLISGIGLVEEASRAVSIDLKAPGDFIYLLGSTSSEFGGSEYAKLKGQTGGRVAQVNSVINLRLYQAINQITKHGLLASAVSLAQGGLAAALAKTAMAGKLGINVSLEQIASDDLGALFSESQGRVLVSINPADRAIFERFLVGLPFQRIGTVSDDQLIKIAGTNGSPLVSLPIDHTLKSHRATLEAY